MPHRPRSCEGYLPGYYFGTKSFSPPDPASVWLKLPPRVKIILNDGQDCRNQVAEKEHNALVCERLDVVVCAVIE